MLWNGPVNCPVAKLLWQSSTWRDNVFTWTIGFTPWRASGSPALFPSCRFSSLFLTSVSCFSLSLLNWEFPSIPSCTHFLNISLLRNGITCRHYMRQQHSLCGKKNPQNIRAKQSARKNNLNKNWACLLWLFFLSQRVFLFPLRWSDCWCGFFLYNKAWRNAHVSAYMRNRHRGVNEVTETRGPGCHDAVMMWFLLGIWFQQSDHHAFDCLMSPSL